MSKTKQFEGKVIIVTGAGTGMGADTALLLAERGAKVAIMGRREDPLRDVEAQILSTGGEALVISGDVSKPQDANRMVDQTVKRFGALHGAVNNAGIASESHDLPELPYELWDKTIGINLSSIFYCMRAQLPEIEKAGGGAIVNVSSVFADRGLPMRAAYSASKHGIRGITRSSALDWAARGIRINELQPGVIGHSKRDGSELFSGKAEESEASPPPSSGESADRQPWRGGPRGVSPTARCPKPARRNAGLANVRSSSGLLRLVVKNQKLVFSERQLSVGSALIVGEFDLEDAGRKRFDDGSDLAAKQAIAGQVGDEGDDI